MAIRHPEIVVGFKASSNSPIPSEASPSSCSGSVLPGGGPVAEPGPSMNRRPASATWALPASPVGSSAGADWFSQPTTSRHVANRRDASIDCVRSVSYRRPRDEVLRVALQSRLEELRTVQALGDGIIRQRDPGQCEQEKR